MYEGKIVEKLNNQKNSIKAKVEKPKMVRKRKKMKEILSQFQVQQDEQVILQKGSQEFNGLILDYGRFIYSNFKIQYTHNNEIQYLRDGLIIRTDQIIYTARKPEILTNLEQIKHLQWFGQVRENNHKIGKWIATWQSETIKDVGGQYSQIHNFSSNHIQRKAKSKADGENQFKIIGCKLMLLKQENMMMEQGQGTGNISLIKKKYIYDILIFSLSQLIKQIINLF
ncbi:unnamed protein product [Paramecium pentaurelia]|uniref:Uncharacterized protein n=1 Tax=Paramecium pentaurelia TaxID=43138 RepID=A0A8S1YJH1_9CILI|nr:unnamed protein product [Paramecium pentaurelia]